MNTGQTFIEINYNNAWVLESLAGVQAFSWLFEWGMYIFLLLTIAILFWIFFDSVTKRKDQQALVPRILSMVGFFMVIPAFIFRFTGNADGVTTVVRLAGEPGTPYFTGPINWNVNWLVSGYGPMIALICLAGVVISIIAIVVYASTVHRAKPSTEFVQAFNGRMSELEGRVSEVSRAQQSAPAPSSAPSPRPQATVFDRKPQAATIIDVPRTGDTLTVRTNGGRANVYNLPEADVVFGRDSSCYAVVDDGKVSSKHLKLSYVNGAWYAMDLGSTNGSYLNNQKLNGQQQLYNGDQIRCGDTTLTFGSR